MTRRLTVVPSTPRFRLCRLLAFCAALACVVAVGVPAGGQVVRLNRPGVLRPRYVSVGVLSLTASPSTVTVPLVAGGQAAASSVITVTTNVNLTVLGTFSVYAYFATPNALTSTNGDIIPSSAVYGRVTSGIPVTFTPFTQNGPFATGSSLLLFQSGAIALVGIVTESLYLRFDLSGQPQQPAGVYTGTLILRAQAI